jgi:hypothetical protein
LPNISKPLPFPASDLQFGQNSHAVGSVGYIGEQSWPRRSCGPIDVKGNDRLGITVGEQPGALSYRMPDRQNFIIPKNGSGVSFGDLATGPIADATMYPIMTLPNSSNPSTQHDPVPASQIDQKISQSKIKNIMECYLSNDFSNYLKEIERPEAFKTASEESKYCAQTAFVLSFKCSKPSVTKGYICGICGVTYKDMSAFKFHVINDQGKNAHKCATPYIHVFNQYKYGRTQRSHESFFQYNVHKHLRSGHKVFSIPFEIFMNDLTQSSSEAFKTELHTALSRLVGCAIGLCTTEKLYNDTFQTPGDVVLFLNEVMREMMSFIYRIANFDWFDLFHKMAQNSMTRIKYALSFFSSFTDYWMVHQMFQTSKFFKTWL